MGKAQGRLEDSRTANMPHLDRQLARNEELSGTSDELRHRVRETRRHMDGVLEELTERLSPRELLAQARRWWRERRSGRRTGVAGGQEDLERSGREEREIVRRFVSDHVWSLGLLASGAAVMMLRMDEPLERLVQQGSRRAIQASKRQFQDVKCRARAQIKTRLSAGGDRWQRRASEGRDYLRERVQEARAALRDNPLAAGGMMLGLGIGCGLLLPASRREDELMGEAAEEAKTGAGKVADASVTAALGRAKQELKKPRKGSQYAS